MESYRLSRDAAGRPQVEVPYRGTALLAHPMFNKSSAFSAEERLAFELEGRLPHGVSTIEQQVRRIYGNVRRCEDPLEQYVQLAMLQDRNEHLFYRLLLEHIDEFLPIVYTPTVGRACQEYSQIFRRARGIWITPDDKGRIYEVLGNVPFADVRLIVATDNERILGLGDQGAGGMGIPIGKLNLYCVAAGIHPSQTLPVSLDVGTDNQALLADELYLGWREPRLRGAAYQELVDELVDAVKRRFPGALLQWEDFKKQIAFDHLDRYRDVITSFNDDIEGTAAVALAGVMASGRVSGRALRDERVVILGAGAAGIGIARQLRDALRREGKQGDALIRSIALIDSRGLLVDPASQRDAYKADFAWPTDLVRSCGMDLGGELDLPTVVKALEPTVLIGTSGQPGMFTEEVVRAMAAKVERPVVFPLSNPTSKAEGKPAEILRWSDGRALIATGSPFDPVEHGGRVHRIAQGNNVYIFPGVGLGVLLSGAKRVTDAMFTAAAHALADQVEPHDLETGRLYPPIPELRQLTAKVAEAVIREARDSGLAATAIEDEEIPGAVRDAMWYPEYPAYVAV